MFDVIVIGGGPAGVTAALRCRELGASVALVERGRMGGTCTNDGCVPTRVLARTARLLRDAQHFDEFGIVGNRPQVDFDAVMRRTRSVVYSIHEKKQLIGHLSDAGVQLLSEAGDASFVDPQTISVGSTSTRLQATTFILCVGGHARRLTFPGAEYALTHSDVWNMKQLPRSVAIVGASATGCQLASIFAEFGSTVHLLELGSRILPGEDEAVSHVMEQSFRRRGITIITNFTTVDRIDKTDDGLRLTYIAGTDTHEITTDDVILAVGWPGNLDALHLEAADVKTERGYIVVDDYLRTTAPHIFAAGDVTGRMMLVQSASYDARIAAENAVLGARHAYQHKIVPHGGFTDPEYGSVGLTEDKASANEAVDVAVVPYADIDRAVIDAHLEGLCKLVVSNASRQIVGAHVVGEQALEVTQMVAAGMAANMTIEQLAELELAYPTYAAIVGLAARQIVRQRDSAHASPQWHALGKRVTVEWERRQPD